MRVTNEMQFAGLLRNTQRTLANMTKVQDQVASGVRLQRPSDGPAEMVRILKNRQDDARLTVHLATIRDVTIALDASATALTDAKDVLTHAKDIALQAANTATSDPTADEALAQEIDGALSSLLQIANRKLSDGRSLFAGTASQTTPFIVSAKDSSGRPTQIDYQGSNASSQVLVGPGQTFDALIPGNVFQMPNADSSSADAKDAFQVLMKLRDDIRNKNGLSTVDRNAALTKHLDELDRVTTGVLESLATQGVQSELLTQWSERVTDRQSSLQKQNSELESVDVAAAITELTQQQNLYKISLSLIQQVNSLSLVDFLR
ncbi:MAG: flagellar hook-associated protein FlgL [Planctomycetia bacterium]|nr:flagellar hook-associated protein FlgL [Planctomycetia bacterium]